jgi:hypothetical protein
MECKDGIVEQIEDIAHKQIHIFPVFDDFQKVSDAVKVYDFDTYLSINKMAQKEFGLYS